MDDNNRPVQLSPALDLQKRVCQFLIAANVPALRHIDVEVQHDSVILNGRVQTFYEKQMATEFARRVAGVVNVVNLIDVQVATAKFDDRLRPWRSGQA